MSESQTGTGELAEELHAVVGALVRSIRTAAPARDITLAQLSILKRLDREGPHTAAELARADKITHQSAAATVAALVDRRLVQRRTDPADLRRRVLTLTDTGRELVAERRNTGDDHLADLLVQRLSDSELDEVRRALPLLRRLL
ncbi:MarR family winged helix-turn-helix transcriptional regulator [Nocardia sp. NPDC101769]|uniref:MarR family winged helix-turn-helix transcriptional regulator n=1 Tax=Nocardia sp. NPDC101769 TaxID=3364333 RepID=UPI0038290D3B